MYITDTDHTQQDELSYRYIMYLFSLQILIENIKNLKFVILDKIVEYALLACLLWFSFEEACLCVLNLLLVET